METIRRDQVAASARRLAGAVGGGLVELAVGRDARRPAPAGRLRWLRRRATLLLAVLAVPIALAMINEVRRNLGFPDPVALPVAVLLVLPVVLLARWPLLGWRIAFLTAAVLGVIARMDSAWPWHPVQIIIYVLAFVVAGLRVSRPALAAMWVLTVLSLWVYTDTSGNDGNAIGGSIVITVLAVAVDAIGSRRRAQRQLTAETERTELEKARRAVLEERTRIARELHDVVAHHVSLIAVQAESAPYRLPDLPEPARDEFAGISSAARESLHEMRRLLGVLRSEQPAERAPQPDLGDLDTLLDTARHAGLNVELTVAGAGGPDGRPAVPATVGTSAYRIIQESLTNAGRHAPGAPVRVRLATDDHAVRIEVANGPGQAGHPDWPGQPGQPGQSGQSGEGGHGLVGMRERATMLGGTLEAGPAPGGGFRVAAVLPLTGGGSGSVPADAASGTDHGEDG